MKFGENGLLDFRSLGFRMGLGLGLAHLLLEA